MKNSISATLTNLCKRLLRPIHKENPIDILSAFVRDTEHELITVVTALQAHIDLLHYEQVFNKLPVERFNVLNRAISRLIEDTTALASLSELAKSPQSKHKFMLDGLMKEVATETRSAFSDSQVSLSCDITKGTSIIGDAVPLKTMLTGMVLALLHSCHKLETIRITGRTSNKGVSMSFDTGPKTSKGIFKPWRLGELRLIPANGEGISLSAIDAIARLHNGQLSVSTLSDHRHEYRLSFPI